MIYLILLAILIILIFLFISEKEKTKLSINRINIKTKKLNESKKFIFLTDIHDAEFGKDNVDLINKIKNEKPDYVLIGGDTIVTKRDKTDFRVLDNLLRDLTKFTTVIYANGNHEQRLYLEKYKDTYGTRRQEFLDILDKYSIEYLSDAHIDLGSVRVYGVNLPQGCYQDVVYDKINDQDLNNKLGEIDNNFYNILLVHSPMFLDVYAAWGADLSLSGHFHGGVMRLFNKGILTSQWQLFHKWCVGTFKIKQLTSVVSRGIGGHTINVRINNKPEITVIEIN